MKNPVRHKTNLLLEYLSGEEDLAPTHSRAPRSLGVSMAPGRSVRKPFERKTRPDPAVLKAQAESAAEPRLEASASKFEASEPSSIDWGNWQYQLRLARQQRLRLPYPYKRAKRSTGRCF
jgi:hypothetical protein